MKGLAVFLAVTLGLGAAAEARMHHPYRGHRIVLAEGAPLDGFTAPSGAYSFRKLRSAYAGAAVRLRRASDNAEADINFLGFSGFTGAPWDAAAANAHCAATSCFVRTMYDQSGLARDLGQAAAANQPELVFNCQGTLPCLRTTINTQSLSGPSVTPATGVVSFSVVARREGGVAICSWLRQNGAVNRIQSHNIAANWLIQGSSGSLVGAAADAAWHSAQGMIAGASSVISVDGTESAGAVTGGTAAGAAAMVGAAAGTVCHWGEVVVWDNYQLTPAERTVLTSSQRSFWGF